MRKPAAELEASSGTTDMGVVAVAVELKSLVPGRGTCRTRRWEADDSGPSVLDRIRPSNHVDPTLDMDGGECISF
ncbi:hypothetical protein GW17_00001041 [Ensete ventricosum]|nr:hypothetical protein GW17_00001041 [Ensete ventricosum]RZS17979.1 hypothetical protein BHM03_00050191 [Ensete ventricosum]